MNYKTIITYVDEETGEVIPRDKLTTEQYRYKKLIDNNAEYTNDNVCILKRVYSVPSNKQLKLW